MVAKSCKASNINGFRGCCQKPLGRKKHGRVKDGIVISPTHFTYIYNIYNTSEASIIPQVVVSSSHLFSIGGFSPSVFKSPTAIEFKGEIN